MELAVEPKETHFVSQHSLNDPEWNSRICALASLKMVMEFWASRNPACRTATLDELLALGLKKGAYLENIGWSHRGIVEIANAFGYMGFNRDFAPQSPSPASEEEAWKILEEDLAKGPVLVSVWSRFDPGQGGGHIVLAERIEGDRVELLDPEGLDQEAARKNMSKPEFLAAFKRRSIIIRPYDVRPMNFETYLDVIRGLAGTTAFQKIWARVDGEKKNIVRDGDISCAFFVTFVLSAYGWLRGGLHATLGGAVRDLKNSGWIEIGEPRPGCVLLWEEILHPSGEMHPHIGFYLGNEEAVSNHPVEKIPLVHHWTFDGTRKVEKMYWNPAWD